jgi:sulfane dehydrogenase subunit SoxC
MSSEDRQPGRVLKAPENFLDPAFLQELRKEGIDEHRRNFIRKSFLAAGARR